jgi:hypothetical protein
LDLPRSATIRNGNSFPGVSPPKSRLVAQVSRERCFPLWEFAAVLLGVLLPMYSHAQTNVLTYHNDLARTGQNPNETVLTPDNVNADDFGELFTYPLDGWVFTHP